jgi:hypothetical protein
MALIQLPNDDRAQAVWRLVMPSQQNLNPFTGRRQSVAGDRGWWECDYTIPTTVGQADYYAWGAFIRQAQNPDNTFRVRTEQVEQNGYNFTSQPGNCQVNGVGQTGRSFNIDGMEAGSQVSDPVLPAGAFLTIEDTLYQLTSGIAKTGANQAISVEPPLRSSPADNAPVSWLEPYCLMYLAETPDHPFGLGNIATLTLKFREFVQ